MGRQSPFAPGKLTLTVTRVKAGQSNRHKRRRMAGSKVLRTYVARQLPTAGFNGSCRSFVEADRLHLPCRIRIGVVHLARAVLPSQLPSSPPLAYGRSPRYRGSVSMLFDSALPAHNVDCPDRAGRTTRLMSLGGRAGAPFGPAENRNLSSSIAREPTRSSLEIAQTVGDDARVLSPQGKLSATAGFDVGGHSHAVQ